MENSLTARSNSQINGQNVSSNNDMNQKYFSINDLNKALLSNKNGNDDKQKILKKQKSAKIRKFLSESENDNRPSKAFGTIKEIVIDDQNENMVSNNPKKRFMVKENKKVKKEKKKKINFIEELRDFDRKQQINFENYINTMKQKKFENSYNKTLKKNYENIYNMNSLNNGLFNPENNNINDNNDNNNSNNTIDERLYKTPAEKDKNNNNDNENNDSFEILKKKYFSANIFSSRFPSTEYKTKFLNNFFRKDSVVKNLFSNYNETKNDKNNININTNTKNINAELININNISPTNIHNINFNSSINNSVQFNPLIKLNQSSDINLLKNNYNKQNFSFNNRYINTNLNEQSLNSNRYSSVKQNNKSHRYQSPINIEIENKYNKVLNSIDEKLNISKYKKKFGNSEKIIFKPILSSDKVKKSSYININKSYKFFENNSNNRFNNIKSMNNFFNSYLNTERIGFHK